MRLSDPPEVLNETSDKPCILVVDHATNYIPPDYAGLGLSDNVLSKHIAFDIGIGPVARQVARQAGVATILAPCSRLLVDPNRWVEEPGCIPEISDGIRIEANESLCADSRAARLERFFWPYHERISTILARLTRQHPRVVFLGLHSCTRVLGDMQRIGDAGTFWHENDALSRIIVERLTNRFGLKACGNYPYNGEDGSFTIDYHTWGQGHLTCGLEILNDRLRTPDQIAQWSERLCDILHTAMAGLEVNSPDLLASTAL
ncbi:N-formylglutamate amidohydrolase [Komagataeibacter xylinus]|uniref:N-formylglutamate amidohydrolase n=1 Tax=Komagataeibacter xylinus TaxID=28448 RepID=A0A857FLN4_KOMXY|nr:N-formylglutamate amidohydrolase [Komagataeibacter xylinus]QHC35178.1 N-formylglutamate amidohydrolase [Komagataeibacter xylinus]